MIKYIFRFIPLVISTLVAFFSVFSASFENLEADKIAQAERIAALEQAYNNGEIPPVDETVFFNGDLEAELESGIRFNELRYIATHNSYQTASTDELKKVYKNLSELTFGFISGEKGDFVSPTLTEQFNNGIYSIELDVETYDKDGEISFTCMHSPCIDMGTSCYDFELALKEISMWSDNNPNHLPITIIVEFKELFIPLEDMQFLNIDYAKAFDETLRKGLGDKLFTPADMLGNYASFADLRADDGWCEVKDMLGKVLVIMHDCSITDDYIGIDSSMRTQAMFPMMETRYSNRDCAAFLIENDPEKAVELSDELIRDGKFIVRTRADEYGSVSEERRKLAFESGAQIISSDYPVKDGIKADDYFVSFEGIKTISP